ncbi:hypothetical protein [Thermococcus litoralis]|uniref:hypothetical protein n=1 Tax=Thermococcus litoralis TaxID=2265 RepID=UPI000B35BA84|nr:hypothetical protein [Thermococcus litoralis]
MEISGKDIIREQVKGEVIAFVTGRKEKPTLNQILGKVKSYVLKGFLTKEELMQMLEEIEEGVKSGRVAPMSPGKIERFQQVKEAIEKLLETI